MRPEWSSYAAPSAPSAPSVSEAPAPDPGPPTRAQRLASEPTDELFPAGRLQRDPTLKLEQGGGAPAPVVPPMHPPILPPDDGVRRWPWVLIALLPIVVIVGSGIWLFILLSHA